MCILPMYIFYLFIFNVYLLTIHFLFFCSTKKIEKGETPCKVMSHTRTSLLFVACKNLTDLKQCLGHSHFLQDQSGVT
jgi:hypothetical protein